MLVPPVVRSIELCPQAPWGTTTTDRDVLANGLRRSHYAAGQYFSSDAMIMTIIDAYGHYFQVALKIARQAVFCDLFVPVMEHTFCHDV